MSPRHLNSKIGLDTPFFNPRLRVEEALWQCVLNSKDFLRCLDNAGVLGRVVNCLLNYQGFSNERIFSLMFYYKKQLDKDPLEAILTYLPISKKNNLDLAVYLYFSWCRVDQSVSYSQIYGFFSGHVKLVPFVRVILAKEYDVEISSENITDYLLVAMKSAISADRHRDVSLLFDCACDSNNVNRDIVSVMMCSIIIECQTFKTVAAGAFFLLARKIIELLSMNHLPSFGRKLLNDYNKFLTGSELRSLLYHGQKPVEAIGDILRLLPNNTSQSHSEISSKSSAHGRYSIISNVIKEEANTADSVGRLLFASTYEL